MNDSAAHAGSQDHAEDDALPVRARGAHPGFSQGETVRVVLDLHLPAQQLFQVQLDRFADHADRVVGLGQVRQRLVVDDGAGRGDGGLALAPERIHWFSECDISIADDPQLLDLMRESGCRELLIGLESPSLTGIDGVEQRRNWKRTRFDDYRDDIGRIQDHGIAEQRKVNALTLDVDNVPLVVAAPLIGVLFDMRSEAIGWLALTLLLGTPILSLLGAVGAALTLGLRSGAALVFLLVLPLTIPALIFGTGAVGAVDSGLSPQAHLSLLGALLIATAARLANEWAWWISCWVKTCALR